MMKVKVIICNCRGTSSSFQGLDMKRLPFTVEGELDVEYSVIHPEVCGPGGNTALADLMKSADRETYIICGACDPQTQRAAFADLLRVHKFPEERFIAVDIRGVDNDGVVNRLRPAVEAILGRMTAP